MQGKIIPRYCETVDEVLELIDYFNAQDGMNTYFTPSTFEGFSRQAVNSIYIKSFFLDIDCGEDKPYATQEDGMLALDKFIKDSGFPEPVRLNSGRGLYAYWIFDEQVATTVWKPHAEKFKKLALDLGFEIDTAVPADAARLIRCPDTLNWGKEKRPNVPPLPTALLTDLITYPFEELTALLDSVQIDAAPDDSVFSLKSVQKGIDDETRKMLGMDNYEFRFDKIAVDSMEGKGCNQLKWYLTHQNDADEPIWHSVLTIAEACVDADEATHMASNEHDDYTYEETERKRNEIRKAIEGTHTCTVIEDRTKHKNPKGCEGCQFKGKFRSPYALGKTFLIAKAPVQPEPTQDATNEAEPIREIPKDAPLHLPDFLKPFVKGVHGGIYYQPPTKTNKDGSITEHDPILLTKYDLYPTKRLFSPYDGECLNMRLVLPRDGAREFMLPMKSVSAQEEFKKIMSSNGVFFDNPTKVQLLMTYITKWGNYMIETDSAQTMRIQQGWTETGYVLGEKEYHPNGKVSECPPSPLSKPIVNLLRTKGTYEGWRKAADMLNDPGYEFHAFALLYALGSPLLKYTNVHGAVVGLLGDTGVGKSGALYAGLSVYGEPKPLAVMEATDNGLIQRMLTFKNHMFGLDEFSNATGESLSKLIYALCAGRGKIRLQSSTNAERPLSLMSCLLSMVNMNQSAREKIAQYKKNVGAEEVRYLEFTVEKPMVPGFELDDARGIEMFEPFHFHYGHAGPRFIAALLNIPEEEIRERINRWRLRLTADLTNSSEYRFINSSYSAVFAAGEIAVEEGVIKIDIERVYQYMVIETRKIIKQNTTRGIDYENMLGEFLNQNLPSMLAFRDNKVVMEPRNALIMRADADLGILQIAKTPLKEFLAKGQAGVKAFEEALKNSGVLVSTDKKVRLGTGWKAAAGIASVYVYEFKTDLSGVIKHVEEEEPTGGNAAGRAGVDLSV